MSRIPIVIASHDKAVGTRLTRALASAPHLMVSAVTSNLMETFSAVEEAMPRAVLITEDMTRYDEFKVMRGLFEAMQIRWITVSIPGARPGAGTRHNASSGLFPISAGDEPSRIRAHVEGLLHIGTPASASTPIVATSGAGASSGMILIGCSTGGVEALTQVLRAFPADCPPTFIVQHTSVGFGASLVRLLDKQIAPRLVLAQDDMTIARGMVCLGAGMTRHLTLSPSRKSVTSLVDEPPVSGHRPSIDRLFHSAVPWASSVTAVIMTGMGKDGAAGLLALRRAGATTFGQDEASSIVYGMPRVAHDMGAVERQLPLPSIAGALLRSANTRKGNAA